MSESREQRLDRQFRENVAALRVPQEPVSPGPGLSSGRLWAMFQSQLTSRHIDFAARELRARGAGYYTIGSCGHEGNAAVAEALRPTDPALLHYRSGAFFVHRAGQASYRHAVRDVLLGTVAGRDEPIAGGRHKVFGSRELAILPQTSTIASHLPKSVGMAFALARAARLGRETGYPRDAVVVCSFGDASTHHTVASGAFDTAASVAYQRLPLPLLFVCEDNGLGISVTTPVGWLEASLSGRPGLRYFAGDGLDISAAHGAAQAAVDYVRKERAPAILHLSTVRLLGHAGSDLELAYRKVAQIRADEARDPVLATARLLVEAAIATSDEVLAGYERGRTEVQTMADEVAGSEGLRDADDVMRHLAPRRPRDVAAVAEAGAKEAARRSHFEERLPEEAAPGTLAVQLGRALGDLLLQHEGALVFGEDVGRKGGVYGVTKGLQRRLGVARVFDTLLDEPAILGMAIGAAQAGFLPIAEIQYLAYLHNAIDQLRGEASSLSFFSQGAFKNALVVRIASYGYQKGFGGHFHNDNAVAALREIPGLVIASPCRGDDAVGMLRSCVAAGAVDGTVSAFLEPIALYATKDLLEAGDEGWLTDYPAPGHHVPIGEPRLYGHGEDLLLVSFANGVPMSLRVAAALGREGFGVRVLDLRWLAPLAAEELLRQAEATGRVLVVDETRKSGGVSEAVFAALIDGGYRGALSRVTSHDSFIPLGPAADLVLLQEPDVELAARALLA